jgi:DNA-directed RNA polymerase omega subunit
MEKLEKIAQNRYIAVIVAAKHARKINQKILEEKENLTEGEEPPAQSSSTKITTEALKDLLEGKINFEFPKKR